MFDFLNLDSFEFEQLCSEILSIYLGKEFRVFGVGKDGGIDIRMSSGSEDIIGQAKRYKTVTTLFEDELPKLEKLKCKKYYLFLSCPLTPQKRSNLFKTFSKYMDDENFVFDSIALNTILEKQEYKFLVEKHFRLWVTSPDIVKLLVSNKMNIDAQDLIDRISEHKKYYVETHDYIEALNKLKEQKLILIKGEPGVGKTTISEMLVLKMLKDFPKMRLIYTTSSSSESIKDSMSNNPEDMELIYIDDFLGDIYLNLTKEGVNGICSLISFIKSQQNKFLMLNTRVVILNTAIDSYINFQKSLEKLGVAEINVRKLTLSDKAKILYNHIYFSEIPFNLKKEFIEKKQYYEIINHQNYSPRLIECLSNNKSFELSKASDYFSYCKSVLENQERTWDDCYQRNLTEPDRILLLVLFSLINKTNMVYESFLRKAYIQEISKGYSIDLTIDNFKNSLSRLTETFVGISFFYNKRYVSFLNPSVKECIKKHEFINRNPFIYFEQFVFKNIDYFKSSELTGKIKDNNLNDYQFSYFQINYVKALYFYFNSDKTFSCDFYDAFIDALQCDLKSKNLNVFQIRDCDIFLKLIDLPIFKCIDLNVLDDESIKQFVLTCLELLDVNQCKEIFERFNHDELIYILDDDEVKEYFLDDEFDSLDVQNLIDKNMVEFEDYGVDFDEDSANDDAVDEISDSLDDNDEYNFLYDYFNFSISRDDISDFLDSKDLHSKFDSYLNSNDHEFSSDNFGYSSETLDVDLLFSSLLK